MENKKGIPNPQTPSNEAVQNEIPKHSHQHPTPLQHLRLLQYGLKMSNQHPHQQMNSPLHLHLHQPVQYQHLTNYVHQHPPQNSPQVWVPHQPPVHYHHQQPKLEQKVQTVKPKENLERKKSNNSTQMRSPVAKRPPGAPVTMQGWLYKQGSEGLMLWKKRWFVLSEYCMFYYKSPEEEKLLGSILLPSYKVSICGPDDKVNKKFAFKCEHANMRTYILAADSQELMLQWIRVLNLACLLQSNPENDQQLNVSNESDREYRQHYPAATNHTHSSSNTTELSNPSQEISQYSHQPLYANAPPKPRRLNDGSYTSSSPDVLERYNSDVPIMRSVLKTPIYNHMILKSQSPQPEYVHHRPPNEIPEYMYTPPNIPQNMERRTPDTYGRSKLNPKSRFATDYEDVYAEQMYKRPLSPVAYTHVRKNPVVNAPYRAYTPPNMVDTKDVLLRKSPAVARPHSADFLEYELNHRRPNANVTRQQPRPKSSLDINRYNGDNYFYSEERYAEKMRKSAQYLPNMPKYYTHHAGERKVPNTDFTLMRSNTQPIDFNNLQVNQPVRSRSVLSEGSLSREFDVDLRGAQSHRREPVSPAFTPRPDYVYCNEDIRNKENEQFIRSASARLTTPNDMQESSPMSIVGDRKREESMKRLLEWKQRMLQSPLNRKVQNHRVYSGKPQMYSKKQEMEFATKNQGNLYSSDGRRSANALPQYNSYSSDDEDNEEGSKENVRTQAGRTLDTISNNESHTPAHTASITVFNTLEPDKPLKSDTMHDNSQHRNQTEESTFTKPLIELKDTSNLAHVSSLRSEYSDKFEPSPIVTEIKSNGALVKSILAEFEKTETEENYMTMTPKKSILEPRLSTSSDATLIFNEMDENPYVEMTHNLNLTFLESQFLEHEPYEMVCFNGNKFEPVYMELKNPNKTKELPDVIVKSGTKSDSSDADDEASKDLDSLDTPSNPRFSLSDNFRPASYYLGARQTVTEFQDSSDSELVSPPPIPTSPPPLEDLDTVDHKKGNTKETSSICSDITENDRLRSRLSQNSDSDIELRVPVPRSSDYDKLLKRRPVSEEVESDFNETVDLDKFLDLNDSLFEKQHDYENLCLRKKSESDRQSILSDDHKTESRASTSELCAFLNSPRSTQSLRISSSLSVQEIPSSYFSDHRDISSNSVSSAPYYYSDLCMNASDTESTSTILTLNNQRASLGNKRDITRIMNPIKCNRPDSQDNTFKLAAEARSASVDFLNLTDKSGHIDKKNIYESDTLKRLKVSESQKPETRNLYLPFKLDKFNNETNVRRSHSLEGLLENVFNEQNEATETEPNEGSYLWEEDSIWRERLRSASQRHTKSMDDLDSIGDKKVKSPRSITRVVTYVNDNVYNMPVHGVKKEGSFVIDREKLRQWDLMSSAPSDDQLASQGPLGTNTVLEIGDGSTCEPVETFNNQPETASGSIQINPRFPKRVWTNNASQSRSVTNLTNENFVPPQEYYMTNQIDPHKARKEKCPINDKMNVSAGELLGRTHEELVLLLIQLRRQNSNTLLAVENCYNEIDTLQAQLHGTTLNQTKRLENLQKLEQIKQHLIELEKQYEKGKPLVNLVDNMVKLGSLYRTPNERNFLSADVRDRLEFNQQIQERRLLAEERRDWNRVNFNHTQLQEKVQQLYKLDKLIQEESGTLQTLQQDKEDIEKALGGLKHRLNKGFSDPAEIEEARKLQMNLENELSRVHLMLAQNSKRLEETVAGNARLEQELLILKQKLQKARQHRSSPQFSNAGDSLPCASGTSAMLESDLQRVQQKVGDLQKQRRELCLQVRQLTDRSHNLQQQVKNSPSQMLQCQSNKRKINSFWRETDLDTMNIIDHGDSWDNQFFSDQSVSPLYINTKQNDDPLNRTDSDENSQNAVSHEKPEIKTVRIVKRESERRQRDREKSATGKWEPVLEEDTSSQNSSVLFRPTANVSLSRQSSISSPSLPQTFSEGLSPESQRSPELSPIFKSEAARQIITEMSTTHEANVKRRAVPIEKRRHYTAPHNNLMKSLNQLPTDDDSFDKLILNDRRARDDLDMERALRQRIDAPDVVRSTLSNKELKYNESTIDHILGTPNKISIPERYIPEQLPQLSAEEQEHRLRKVESIKKMLSDSAIISTSSSNLVPDEKFNKTANTITNKATTKMIEEKKQREHLLQLNQILAKQVMEMSKIVAVKALATLPLQPQQMNTDEEDSSPVTPLPLYQQRDNFYS